MVQKTKNGLHERIRQRIEELGLSEEAASLLVGTDRSYFRKLFERPNSHPRIDTLQRIATALNTDVSWLTVGATALSGSDTENLLGPNFSAYSRGDGQAAETAPALPARADMPLDIPVMGTAAGSHLRGAFQFEGGIVDYVRRPPALVGAREIYGLYVEGSSMEPQYFPGDLIYVHPHRPPRVGDIVVVQCRNGEHAQGEATLGIYRRKTEKAIVIGKRNPVAEIEVAREHVTAVHRVLSINELFGV